MIIINSVGSQEEGMWLHCVKSFIRCSMLVLVLRRSECTVCLMRSPQETDSHCNNCQQTCLRFSNANEGCRIPDLHCCDGVICSAKDDSDLFSWFWASFLLGEILFSPKPHQYDIWELCSTAWKKCNTVGKTLIELLNKTQGFLPNCFVWVILIVRLAVVVPCQILI